MRASWIAPALVPAAGFAGADGKARAGFDERIADYEALCAESDPIRLGRRGDPAAAARWADPWKPAVCRARERSPI